MKKEWQVDPKDPAMCKWVYNYLSRRFSTFSKKSWESEYKFYERIIENQAGVNDKENLLKNLQAAWRQKKYREKQKSKGNKQCSFILSTVALKELDKLATRFGASINDTLESIIRQTYFEDREQKKEKKKQKPVTDLHTSALAHARKTILSSDLAQEAFNGSGNE